ncbi:hypothetical protein [Isoptericola sp. NPDC055881]
MALNLDRATLDAAVVLLLDPHAWRHRRVDSVHLEAGERGRWRASVDCTPPKDPAIPYGEGQFVVPLAYVKKGPMRDLNVTDDTGTPLPVLTSRENTDLAALTLLHLLDLEGIRVGTPLVGALIKIVSGDGGLNDVDDLLRDGVVDGVRVLSRSDRNKISDHTQLLMRNLAQSFILGVVVSGDRLGRRQLIKFSNFWHVDPTKIPGLSWWGAWVRIIRGSFGFKRGLIALDVPMAGDAASFHLEFHPPEGFSCRVELPPMRFFDYTRAHGDRVPTSVGHAYGAYHQAEVSANLAEDPARAAGEAALELYVSRRGPWLVTLLLATFTLLFFLFSLWFDGALYVLRGQGTEGGVDPSAFLLTLPGVLVGLLMTTREHVLASVLLMPIRAAALVCSALLLVASASLAFQLRDPWLVSLWLVGLVTSGTIVLALVIGALVRARRTKVGTGVYS